MEDGDEEEEDEAGNSKSTSAWLDLSWVELGGRGRFDRRG